MKVRIKTTRDQGVTIDLLRRELALLGYYIFPVAEWYRRHHLDFIAVPKTQPQTLVLVRAVANGSVSVRPFASPTLYQKIHDLLVSLASKICAPTHWSDRQLPFSRISPDWWDQYLSEKGCREYKRLVGM